MLEDRRVLTPLVALSTNNELLAFDSSTPGIIQGVLPIIGLPPGESIVGIDARPQTGQLYGLGSANHLYVINTSSGAVTQVGTGAFSAPLSGTAFGFNFDPVADDIRVVSDTGQNMRINADTGAVIQVDTNLNPPGHVVAIAYTNEIAGATSTTLFAIDSASDMFVQIGGTNGNPSPDLGTVTPLAPLGADTSDQVGLDTDPTDNSGYAAVTVSGIAELVHVSLTTGPSPVGPIGNGSVGIRGLAVAALALGPPPSGTPITLLAATRNDTLLQFNSATPSTITSTTHITGLQGGESIYGLAVRPATGILYALGSTSRLYTIDPSTGATTQVGTGTFAVPLFGKAFGFSFDPVADDIRVVSDADLNMRLNPDTGAVIDSDPNTPGIQPDHYLSSTYTVGLANSSPVAGTVTTTLYGIDGANDQLVLLGGPDGIPSPNLGQITDIGSLGVHIDWVTVPTVGFDIAAENGIAFAALPVNGTTSLYTIDLTSGKATAIGPIGTGSGLGVIVGLASGPPGLVSISPGSIAEGSGDHTLTVNGALFSPASTVKWNGTPLPTKFINPSELQAIVPAADVVDEGKASITVSNGQIPLQFAILDNDTLSATSSHIAPTVGLSFNAVVATFTDVSYPNQSPTGFQAGIDWGDGSTSLGMVTAGNNGVFAVWGSHTYSKQGNFPITVGIRDAAPGVATATTQSTASVTVGPPFPADDIVGQASELGQIWVGVSTGSSFSSSLWAASIPGAAWVDVVTGDFNGDGLTDIAARDANTGNWGVGLSNGSGFATTLWTTWSTGVTWVDVQVGDFNGDGKADIVGRVKETGQWWVAQSTGSSFTNSLWGTWSTGATWVDVKVGDFTGDGKSDITGRYLQGGSWWTGVSTGSSFTTSLWAIWSNAVTWVDVQVGDFNGDGKADIAGRTKQSGQWWVGISSGSSFAAGLWTIWSTGVTWVDVKVGDFNGDGKDDIIGRALESGQWWASVSTGSAFFNVLGSTWSTGVTWVDVQVGDFNRDGLADITGRALQSGQWWTSLSNGSTSTTSLWATWSTGVTWTGVRSGDFA